MRLSELFVSHKQVEPVSFDKPVLETTNPIYVNLDRAHKVTSESNVEDASEAETLDMSTWKVPDYDATPGWSVRVDVPGETSWVNPYQNNRNKWVSDITAAYRRAGLNDNAIKNLIAKNALESGWGKSAQGDFNFGNITTGNSWKGRYVSGKDHDSSGNRISQKFRAYDSIYDYVSDEIQFLTNLYDFDQNDDFDTFINKLQGNNSGKRKYAADRNYIKKVRGVYNSI